MQRKRNQHPKSRNANQRVTPGATNTERHPNQIAPKEGNMADTQVKRSHPLAQPKRRSLNPRLKNRVYETVYDLNRGFAVTLEAFDRLERLGFFRRDYLRAFHNMADELRARTNHELTGTLRDREQQETAQFGRIRVKWERRFGDGTSQRPPKNQKHR
jgi:hypothetical protein